jgi:MerR family transcriptional regulator, light-induced transcriptional regulator
MVAVARSNLADLETLAIHLAQLDHGAALALVEQARADGASVEGIVTGLLAPSLVEVGRRWAAGELGAAEALAAAAIARSAIPRVPTPPSRPGDHSVAVCCPPGEHHEIPAEMVTELLRAEGCPAQHLGAGVTPRHLPNFLSRQRPAALLISCTSPCGLPGAARSIEVAHAYGVPVIVGGAAFGRDALLALRLGAAAWAPSARQVVALVETWLSRPAPLPAGRALTEEYLMFEAGLPEIRAGVVASLRRIAEGSDDDPGGVADTQDRLELLLRHLGAALLVDDGRLFLDFLSWRAEYYAHRNVGPERLANALTAVASALSGEFARARRFVEEGRQHVAWLDRSGDNAGPVPAVARFSPADHLPVRPAAGGHPALATADGGRREAFGNPLDVSPAPIRAIALSGPEQAARDQPGRDQPGRVFADLLFVAATACHAPFALISVVQGDGRWSTLSHGVERRDLLADDRLFGVVAAAPGPVEFTDLSRHPDIQSGPIARGPLGVRFVYGVPLRSRQNTLLGVLCVLDKRPRDLSNRERQALTAISRQIVGQLALWRRASAVPAQTGLSGSAAAAADRVRRHDGLAVAAESVSDRPRLHVHRDGGEELLRSHEVAVLFDVTDRTVINWAAANKLPSIRTAGGHLRFRGDDVLALLAGRPVRSAV